MSKFTEKLRHVYSGLASPMGFRRSTEIETPPLLLIADVTKTSAKQTKALTADIDAGVVSGKGLDFSGLGQLVKALGDIPLGLFLESADNEEIAKFTELGGDFVIFSLKTPLQAVKREGVGKIIKIEPSLDQGLTRAISGLPLEVDGVLVTGEEPLITIERLLICQRFAELLDKPLLVSLGSPTTADELKSLYEAGVNGLLLPQGLPAETFADLKKTVGGLSKTAKQRAKGAALLPRLGSEPEAEVQEEEEEEI